MKNSIGTSVILTLFGESHGKAVGGVLDGLPAGIKIDREEIRSALLRRMGEKEISTKRRETDEFEIISGVFNGFTTGSPIAVIIPNSDIDPSSYKKSLPRPSHADFVAEMKYHGFQDFRGGGHFSGRVTAPIVLFGAVCKSLLEKHGIRILTHIKSIANESERSFSLDPRLDAELIKNTMFPVFSSETEEKMKEKIKNFAKQGDSCGGIVECAVCGMPVGVGEPWFENVESEISRMILSIPGIKGIEFGLGFEMTKLSGFEANDAFVIEKNTVKTKTNNSGGINGGITNGMPIIFSSAVKPTPSVSLEQDSVDLESMKAEKLCQGGRHDPCIVPRVAAVIEYAAAISVCDLLSRKFGSDFLVLEK